MVITANLTISETDPTYDGADLVINGPVTVTIDGAHGFSSLTLTNGATLTHSPCTATETHRLELSVSDGVVVSADSRIDVSGKGYLTPVQGGYTSGGSYGGLGGDGHYSGRPDDVAGAVYGDYADPEEWGSGGSSGGSGGGLARLEVGSLHLDGQILANGASAQYGGGSGGGLYLGVSKLK